MDDELNQAAQKHKLSQRQGALRARQRQRKEQDEREAALRQAAPGTVDGSQASVVPTPASSSGAPAPLAGVVATPPANTAAFREAVAVRFKELVSSGMPAEDAATKAIQEVRANILAPSPSSSSSLGPPLAGSTVPSPPPVPEEIPCPGPPYTCFICLDAKSVAERFLPHRCSITPPALCCRPCYVAWVESQIDADAAVIKCCHCDLLLDIPVLARLVDAEHWAKYCDTMLTRSLRRDPAFIWCSKCTGGGWVDLSQPLSKCGWTCPECSNNFVYCSFCRREHGSLSCKAFQQIRRQVFNGGKSRENWDASSSVVQRTSKFCPSCKMPIQKEGGCNFMDCPNCRRHFCWSCGRVLKGSHQAHRCDAGFEGSSVVHRTPQGRPCVEFTRLFTNVVDVENVELMNVDEQDLADFREMLVPGLLQEPWSPLFVGPSACDGEVAVRLPLNFSKSLCWEVTHVLVRACHPPAPQCRAPRSLTLIPNAATVMFSDFDSPTAVSVPLEDTGKGSLLARLEQFNIKGIFKRVTALALRFSITSHQQAEGPDDDGEEVQVYFNDIALFGIPSSGAGAAVRNGMWDERANLIVSPVLVRRRWGEEAADADEERRPPVEAGEAEGEAEAEAIPMALEAAGDEEDQPAGRRGLPMPVVPAPNPWGRPRGPERGGGPAAGPAGAGANRRRVGAFGAFAGRAKGGGKGGAGPDGGEAPPRAQHFDRGARRRQLLCATPGCELLVNTREEFGGYCCIACMEGGDHGPRCERAVAPRGTPRADAGWAAMNGDELEQREVQDAIMATAAEAGVPPEPVDELDADDEVQELLRRSLADR